MRKKWVPLKFNRNNMTKWNWMCQHHENLHCGSKVDIGAFTYINAQHGVHLGDDVQIGSHCSLYTVSTIDDKYGPIVVGKNARIGTHSTIMPGVTIGENAVIGAHSFVNKDVPSGVLACGVPVKVHRRKNDLYHCRSRR
ncbi:MAG: acyltransferase [Candidatus Omnitrophica bacterium]|nr:acyltransferase [Candidatus Omnitrophota bacterium]MDE2223435.1 acyltransferase [Candidatus Omnitrophota bacterium]